MKRLLVALCLAAAVVSPVFGEDKDAAVGTIASVPVTSFYTHESAETLYRQAKYAEAEAMCKKAVADIEKSKGDKSPSIAEPLIDLATVQMRLAHFAEAKPAMDRAESLLDKSKPEQALIYGRLGINKGWRLYILGEAEAAAKVSADSRDLLLKNNVKESRDLAELINNLGLMDEELSEKQDKPELMEAARRFLIQGWQMRRKLTGDESPETAESLNNLGMHLLFNGKNVGEIDLAMSTLTKALDVAKKVYGENHPETAVSHATMALAMMMADNTEDAEKELQIAMPATEKAFGKVHPDRAYELTTLARIYVDQSKFSEAEKAYAEVVSINEEVYGKTSPQVVPALEGMKRYYEGRGDAGKARDMEKRIDSIKGKDI